MGAYDYAETGYAYIAYLRIYFLYLITDELRIRHAVGLQDAEFKTRRVDKAEIVEDTVDNGFECSFSAAYFLCHVESTPVGNLGHGLYVQQRAHKCRSI